MDRDKFHQVDEDDNKLAMTTNREWLPVRCCCQPMKVLGFLNVPKTSFEEGKLNIFPHCGPPVVVDIRIAVQAGAVVSMTSMRNERAIYSEDHPIEYWREVFGPNFIEAK